MNNPNNINGNSEAAPANGWDDLASVQFGGTSEKTFNYSDEFYDGSAIQRQEKTANLFKDNNEKLGADFRRLNEQSYADFEKSSEEWLHDATVASDYNFAYITAGIDLKNNTRIYRDVPQADGSTIDIITPRRINGDIKSTRIGAVSNPEDFAPGMCAAYEDFLANRYNANMKAEQSAYDKDLAAAELNILNGGFAQEKTALKFDDDDAKRQSGEIASVHPNTEHLSLDAYLQQQFDAYSAEVNAYDTTYQSIRAKADELKQRMQNPLGRLLFSKRYERLMQDSERIDASRRANSCYRDASLHLLNRLNQKTA